MGASSWHFFGISFAHGCCATQSDVQWMFIAMITFICILVLVGAALSILFNHIFKKRAFERIEKLKKELKEEEKRTEEIIVINNSRNMAMARAAQRSNSSKEKERLLEQALAQIPVSTPPQKTFQTVTAPLPPPQEPPKPGVKPTPANSSFAVSSVARTTGKLASEAPSEVALSPRTPARDPTAADEDIDTTSAISQGKTPTVQSALPPKDVAAVLDDIAREGTFTHQDIRPPKPASPPKVQEDNTPPDETPSLPPKADIESYILNSRTTTATQTENNSNRVYRSPSIDTPQHLPFTPPRRAISELRPVTLPPPTTRIAIEPRPLEKLPRQLHLPSTIFEEELASPPRAPAPPPERHDKSTSNSAFDAYELRERANREMYRRLSRDTKQFLDDNTMSLSDSVQRSSRKSRKF